MDCKTPNSAASKCEVDVGISVKDTAYGHGRYAAEYAALCGVYNLHGAFDKMEEPTDHEDWKELVKKLEYLAISLSADNEWCTKPKKVRKGDKIETEANLTAKDVFVSVKIEDCQKKIDDVKYPIEYATKAKLEKEKDGEQWEPTENATTKLLHYPRDKIKPKAREKAFKKVLKLLKKANEFKGNYMSKLTEAAKGKWTGIKTVLEGVFGDAEAKALKGKTDTGGRTELDATCDYTKDAKPENKSKAGVNVLVDMACLCIPATGTCTACTGTQPIPAWQQGADITTQIAMLTAGCRARNNYGAVTPELIERAMENFKGLLNRWQKVDGYVLVAGSDAAEVKDMLIFGSGGTVPACSGAAKQHCIIYPGAKDDKNKADEKSPG